MSVGKIGTVMWYSDQNGWGFFDQDEGGHIFVHYSGIVEPGFRWLTEGERVRFTVEQGPNGPAAANVRVL